MGDLSTSTGVIQSLLRVVHTIQQRVLHSSEPVAAFATDLAEVKAIADESAKCHAGLIAMVADEARRHCLAASGSLAAGRMEDVRDHLDRLGGAVEFPDYAPVIAEIEQVATVLLRTVGTMSDPSAVVDSVPRALDALRAMCTHLAKYLDGAIYELALVLVERAIESDVRGVLERSRTTTTASCVALVLHALHRLEVCCTMEAHLTDGLVAQIRSAVVVSLVSLARWSGNTAALRMLKVQCERNQDLVREHAGIAPLVALVCGGRDEQREIAARALGMLAANNPPNQRAILHNSGMRALGMLLMCGEETCRACAASSIGLLVDSNERAKTVARNEGCVHALCAMVQAGTKKQKKNAARALGLLAERNEVIAATIYECGGVDALVEMLPCMLVAQKNAAYALGCLAIDARVADRVRETGGMHALVSSVTAHTATAVGHLVARNAESAELVCELGYVHVLVKLATFGNEQDAGSFALSSVCASCPSRCLEAVHVMLALVGKGAHGQAEHAAFALAALAPIHGDAIVAGGGARLLLMLARAGTVMQKESAAAALWSMRRLSWGLQHGGVETIAALVCAVGDRSVHALRLLAHVARRVELAQAREVIPVLVRLLSEAAVCDEAASAIGALASRFAPELAGARLALVALAYEGSGAAARALSELGVSAAALPAIVARLRSEDPRTREEAALEIGYIATGDALGAIRASGAIETLLARYAACDAARSALDSIGTRCAETAACVRLLEMFPQHRACTVARALADASGDVERAADRLMDGGTIAWSELEVGARICVGSARSVYQAKLRGGDVAVVLAHAAGGTDSAALSRARSRRIVRLLGTTRDESGRPALVTELAAHGSLSAVLQKPLSDRALVRIAMQVCQGMLDAAEAHGDLCARNVLVFSLEPPVVKLGGFGAVSPKPDIRAFGLLLWQMWSRGESPAGDESGITAAPAGCPDHVYSLMCRCWHPNTGEGPTFAELYEALLDSYVRVSEPEQLCVICLDRRASVACVPCGHVCVCVTDAAAGTLPRCPICRALVTGTLVVFEV